MWLDVCCIIVEGRALRLHKWTRRGWAFCTLNGELKVASKRPNATMCRLWTGQARYSLSLTIGVGSKAGSR
eukprot:6207832-Amphidinium_carterae.1